MMFDAPGRVFDTRFCAAARNMQQQCGADMRTRMLIGALQRCCEATEALVFGQARCRNRERLLPLIFLLRRVHHAKITPPTMLPGERRFFARYFRP